MRMFFVFVGIFGIQLTVHASPEQQGREIALSQMALYSNVEFSSVENWSQQQTTYIQNGKIVPEQELVPIADFCALSSIEGPVPRLLPARFQVIEQAIGKTVVKGNMRVIIDVVELTLMSHENGGHWQMACTSVFPQSELSTLTLQNIWGAMVRFSHVEEQRLPILLPGQTAVEPQSALDRLVVNFERDIPLYRSGGSQTVEIFEQSFVDGRVLNDSTSAASHCLVRVQNNVGESAQAAFQAGGAFLFNAVSIRQNRDDYHAESVALVLLGEDRKRVMVCRVPLAEAISVEALNRITGPYIRWTWR